MFCSSSIISTTENVYTTIVVLETEYRLLELIFTISLSTISAIVSLKFHGVLPPHWPEFGIKNFRDNQTGKAFTVLMLYMAGVVAT